MGYASTYEAILEKLTDLAHLADRTVTEAPEATISRERGIEFARVLAQARDAIAQLSGWLDLATNPELDLGRELHEARDAKREMSARIASYERTCVVLAAALDSERRSSKSLRGKLEVEVRKTKGLERALDERVRTKPASVYEAYAPTTREVRKKGG